MKISDLRDLQGSSTWPPPFSSRSDICSSWEKQSCSFPKGSPQSESFNLSYDQHKVLPSAPTYLHMSFHRMEMLTNGSVLHHHCHHFSPPLSWSTSAFFSPVPVPYPLVIVPLRTRYPIAKWNPKLEGMVGWPLPTQAERGNAVWCSYALFFKLSNILEGWCLENETAPCILYGRLPPEKILISRQINLWLKSKAEWEK